MESPQSDLRFHFQNQNEGVVGPQFCTAANPMELTVKKTGHRFGGHYFTILDSNENIVLTVDCPLRTSIDTRILRDQVGNALITLRRKPSFHQAWEAYREEGNGQENLVFTAGSSCLFEVRTSLEVYLGSNSHAEFKAKDTLRGRSYTFYQGTAVIAKMMQIKHKNVFGRLKYAISVNLGVDYAFIVALVVIIEGNSDSDLEFSARQDHHHHLLHPPPPPPPTF